MNKKIACLIIFVGLFCIATYVLAQPTVPNPLCPSGGGPNCINNFGDLLGKIIFQVGLLVAGLGTIMIIVAGILYLISAGNAERMGTAKKALMYAIAGIVVGLAAAAIVQVIKNIIGA